MASNLETSRFTMEQIQCWKHHFHLRNYFSQLETSLLTWRHIPEVGKITFKMVISQRIWETVIRNFEFSNVSK